ncbi:MAG: chitobiase/beta-hexosaminidase C-terminal domain-containing protein [Treponema sp.]|nr:chitobiase/beta-hexosaminidase C-terminal domain-containing protein [Treponema sp.]
MKSLIKKIISITSLIPLIWGFAACSVDATDSKSEPSPKQTVATPVFTIESGEVTTGTPVEITCSTEGAAIYYTTDGSVPTAESTRYTAPIAIEPPMTVKAIAIKKGMNNSAVAEAVYTESTVDYFEGLSDFYGRCDVFNGSNSYTVKQMYDEKICCTYYADDCAQHELSSEILTYSVSGNIASLKGEFGTEFSINTKTKEFVTKKIVFNGNVYDLMNV